MRSRLRSWRGSAWPTAWPSRAGAAGTAVRRWLQEAVCDRRPAAPAGEVICLTLLITRPPRRELQEAAQGHTRPAGDTERQHTRETRRQWTRIPNTTAGGTDDHLSQPLPPTQSRYCLT